LAWVEKRIGLAFAESQVAAIRLALVSKVLVMTGCAYRELRSSVAMMQATDHELHSDAAKPFDWSADRRILG
jgi:hypothetical protein